MFGFIADLFRKISKSLTAVIAVKGKIFCKIGGGAGFKLLIRQLNSTVPPPHQKI